VRVHRWRRDRVVLISRDESDSCYAEFIVTPLQQRASQGPCD
jgi:hypothetical protein